jgi:hypothetical protein
MATAIWQTGSDKVTTVLPQALVTDTNQQRHVLPIN